MIVCLFIFAAAQLSAAFELWVGGSDLRPTSNVVQWVRNLSWADGISVGFPATYNSSDLEGLTTSGFRLLPCVHANLETMQRQLFTDGHAPDTGLFGSAYGTEIPSFRAGTASGPPFMWWALTEDDSSGVGFPYEQLSVPPSSHADAWAQLDAYLQRTQVFANAIAPGVPLVAQIGFAELVHAHMARGVSLAIIERANDDIGDLNTALAFGRGASRQYNTSFGVDLSWWWGVVYGGVNQLPSLYHRRHAYLALYGGASVVNIEGGDGLCDAAGVPFALGREIQAFGSFVRTVRKGNPDLAPLCQPVTPVLLVVPMDHGYATRPFWLTQSQAWGFARLPPRVGDKALRGFFAWIFPGAGFVQDPFPFGAFASNDPPASMWALSSTTVPYAPYSSDVAAAAPYLPFGTFSNRTAAALAFSASGIDPSPWRPMADSLYGGVFDVAVAGLGIAAASGQKGSPNNVVGRARRSRARVALGETPPPPPLPLADTDGYKVCVLLGPVQLTLALKAQLVAFAAAGGHVVVAAGVVGPGDNDLTGIPHMTPELRVGRSWRWTSAAPSMMSQEIQREPFRFVPLPNMIGVSSNFSVLAATVAALPACGNAPCPLAVRWNVGAGAVSTILVPWMEGDEGLATLAQGVLGYAFEAVAPVQVTWVDAQGWPVDFSASQDRINGLFNVVVSNNEEASWRGNITLTAGAGLRSIADCIELRSGTTLGRGSWTLGLTVAAFDVAVIECHVSF